MTITPLFSLACPPLDDLTEKHLYLRDHNALFSKRSVAFFECAAGYTLPEDYEHQSVRLYPQIMFDSSKNIYHQ